MFTGPAHSYGKVSSAYFRVTRRGVDKIEVERKARLAARKLTYLRKTSWQRRNSREGKGSRYCGTTETATTKGYPRISRINANSEIGISCFGTEQVGNRLGDPSV